MSSEFFSKKVVAGLGLLAVLGMQSGCMMKKTDNSAQELVEASKEANAGELAANTDTKPDNYRQLLLMQFSLIFLNARYVEPQRIDWRKMTVYAVDALQNMVPEVVAKFDRRIDDSPMMLDLRVGLESKRYSLAEYAFHPVRNQEYGHYRSYFPQREEYSWPVCR